MRWRTEFIHGFCGYVCGEGAAEPASSPVLRAAHSFAQDSGITAKSLILRHDPQVADTNVKTIVHRPAMVWLFRPGVDKATRRTAAGIALHTIALSRHPRRRTDE